MSKEYIFEFIGTKEDFLNKLNGFPSNTYSDDRFYYFKDYIVELVDDELRFGVERGGHSGGLWFIPDIVERGGKVEFSGTIQHIRSESSSASAQPPLFKRIIDKIGEYLFYIIVAPFILAMYAGVKIYEFFKWLKNKLLGRPIEKSKTTEERLFDLMVNHLGCVGKEAV